MKKIYNTRSAERNTYFPKDECRKIMKGVQSLLAGSKRQEEITSSTADKAHKYI
jgi:hypothetical protein